MAYKREIKRIDISGMDELLSIDNPEMMITMPQYIIRGYIEYKNLEARLVELDLLEQSLNREQVIGEHKLRRLEDLKGRLKI